MSNDWADYLSTDTSLPDAGVDAFDPVTAAPIEPVIEPGLPDSVVEAVETATAGASGDQDWSDWHAASGDQWADSAQDWTDYANQNLAAGDLAAAESGLAHAATHADLAAGNYDVSIDYSTQAATHLDTAAAEIAPYDTYDAGTSFYAAE